MAGLVVSGTQVSYIGQDCREIPEHLGRDCGHFAKRLDLSFNLLRKLLERKRERTSSVFTGPAFCSPDDVETIFSCPCGP
ncbi:leucine-rich melanocyte differentiation-associated protein-like isoform X9 [Bubalus kerabau]|uniref:leucine-rich melanocyte differentiation-associated protein-like isoform X9 n=1 Tax=Bubalus carabanensis TaxID=3119969 RepID=UPI00244E864D|nr:leucine-rich melanocyte differentiation-associated protein-like isoform X9 [Bubalus carabanensis]XP_055392709.1 leucine-rich melanocyte differentiation-associated protein-like isoform X9 [Bubalus carabanensis]